jgi:hypothetical protein
MQHWPTVFLLLCAAGIAVAQAPADSSKPVASAVIRVGPQQKIKRIAEAARIAKDGDTIEIDAGVYARDVAVFGQRLLTIRGVGGRPTLLADGASAEDKAIWVIRGGNIRVENLEFVGARVSDRNGAGIRHETGRLIVKGCVFRENENGILAGNNRDAELEIEESEFGDNGAGDGQSHNLYVGGIRSLKVTGSYFHHAKVGHLIKSRAERSHILYNRLTDEAGGQASYEIDLPSGGLAYVIGNLIEQGPATENSNIISYGAEYYGWPRNELYLINNTIVDNLPRGGTFLRVRPGPVKVKAVNNLLLGSGSLESAIAGEYAANISAHRSDFAAALRQDYRLRSGAKPVGRALDPGVADGVPLRPEREYVHPRQTRTIGSGPYSPGALQSIAP